MNDKPKRKLKDLSLFDVGKIEIKGNRVKPTNDFIEFKKEDIHQSIGSCFEQKVKTYGDKVAVKSDDKSITYGFLNHYANRVAHRVVQEYDDRYRLSENEKTRYTRQLLLHEWGIGSQEKLKSTTVFAAGAGGSGSALLQQLALVGIGTIIICDFDEVELSNLNRQVLHDESRIGMNKALSAKKTLNKINPHVQVIAYPEKITRENIEELAGEAQIIFDNVDDLEAKFVLSEYAVSRKIPHILSSMIDLNAYAVVLHSPYTPCFHCLYDREILEKIETIKAYSTDYQKSPNPVASPALFLCTGFAVNEAIKILLDFENPAYNKYVLFNQRGARNIAASDAYRRLTYPFTPHFKEISRDQGMDWDRGWEGHAVEEIQIKPDPLCPVCSKNALQKAPLNEKFLQGGPGGTVFSKKSPPWPPEANDWQAVALLFGHGIEMIVGLLGVLKSGKVYVPLDPTYPLERLEYMLEDSEARVIVTEANHYSLAVALKNKVNKNIKVINIEEMNTGDIVPEVPGVSIAPDQIAYVLYTSGSTGLPKGVMQSHRNVLHFARVYTNGLHIHDGDRLTLFSSYSFDAAKMDIYGALLNGAALYPFDIKQEGSLDRLPGWIKKEKITIYHSIPTVYRYFVNQLNNSSDSGNAVIKPPPVFPDMRFIVLGGEAVYKNDIEEYKKHFPGDCIFINGLGPTESTVTLQYFINKNTHFTREAVPVGYPADETEVFLLDKKDQETVVNAVGEIIYKSDYLALGYLKKPGKTDEVFVTDLRPAKGNGRVYRSGDLGRRLEDGSIEYVGRKDFQVKVRGYRIELGEIESKLDRIEPISKSVVVCQQDANGENYLTAFYQSSGGIDLDENNLVLQLKEKLPDYMIPGGFYRLEEFPHTPTGKIDRKVLADNTLVQRLNRVAYAAPRSDIEKKMVEIWCQVLDKDDSLGIDDNFFVLGGNSLKAILVTSRIHKALDVKVPLVEVLRKPTIRELSQYVLRSPARKYFSIEAVEEQDYYQLSYNQKRLWFINQLEPASTAYHMPGMIMLEDRVEAKYIKKALRGIMERHESFRTAFRLVEGEPQQFIEKEVEIPFRTIDISHMEEEGKHRERERIFREMFSAPFDLTRAPLFRSLLIKLDRQHFVFVYNMHHIITDGWSMGILRNEFSLLYEAYRAGQEPGLPPLELQYKDFSQWNNKQLADSRLREESHGYWKEKLEKDFPSFQLPADTRLSRDDRTGALYRCTLGKEIKERIDTLAKNHNTTLFMVMFSAYILLLSRLANQKDIACSIIGAGREDLSMYRIIGFFVNSIIYRTRVIHKTHFSDFLGRVNQEVLELFQHQTYPVELVIDELNMRYPDISISFNMLNQQDLTRQLELEDHETFHQENTGEAKFDIESYLVEYKNGIDIRWVYKNRIFKPSTIDYISQEYMRILDFFTAAPGKSLMDYTRSKRNKLSPAAAGKKKYPSKEDDDWIHRRFERQAARTPHKIAVKTCSESITYAELNRYANRIAHAILQKPVQAGKPIKNQRIGLFLEHDHHMIAAILGVLKSGNVYVPLSVDYPAERIAYMLSHSGSSLLVTCSRHKNRAEQWGKDNKINVLDIDAIEKNLPPQDIEREENVTGETPAYILYTSGSTAKPKGVLQNHGNVLYYIRNWTERLSISPADKMTLLSSFGHDASIPDIFGALLNGATLYPFDIKNQEENIQLSQFLLNEKITIWHSVPTLFSYFASTLTGKENFHHVRFILLGGEAVREQEIEGFRKFFPNSILVNIYGQTESTLNALCLIKQEDATQKVTIGEPLDKAEILLMDEDRSQLLPFEIGEIVVVSPCISPGYLNDVEGTGKSFAVERELGKLYRTGDQARLLPDGTIEFIGRKDFQVKVRGYRIELGEIETQLDRIEQIDKSVVVCQQDADEENYLIVFYRTTGGIDVDENNLVLQLKESLPDYMIPAAFYRLDEFPHTPTGKIDRKALADQTIGQRLSRVAYAAPRSEIEKKLIDIWTRVLNRDDTLGIDDNFFVLGGNSLKAILLTSRIHKELQAKVTLAEMFKAPTIRELAKYIDKPGVEVFVSIDASERKEYYPLSSAQRRFYILQQVTPESTAYNMTQIHQLEGDVEKERFEASLKKMIKKHETLRTSFQLIDGEPMQRVHEEVEFEVEYYQVEVEVKVEEKEAPFGQILDACGEDLATEGTEDTEKRNQELRAKSYIKSFTRPFDLTRAPLLQLGLINIAKDRYILMFQMHHIISDGTSMGILLREFMTIYSSQRLQPLRLQYKDFAQWQFNRLASGQLKQQETYWLDRFSGELPVLNMPTDFPRPPIQSFEGNYFNFSLEKSLTNDINHLLNETGTTLFMVLLAVYNILLSRYTGQEDIVIGTTVAGRSHSDLEPIIGLFIETLALRNYPNGEQTFGEFLKEVKQTTVDTYDNQEYPFKELIKQVGAENEISRNPVFDVMLIVQNIERTAFELKGLNFSPYQVSEEESPRMSKVDLTIEAGEAAEEIYFKLEYCTRLYKKETMERLSRHFINIIREVVNNPAIQLSDVQVISQEEKNQLLVKFNDTTWENTPVKMVHELFADQAEETPDNIAAAGPLQIENRTYMTYMTYISYRELNEKSNHLAHLLIEKGVQPDTIVGIMVEPSVDMVIGLLSILKSGAAYLPIDPDSPEERIDYMLSDSNASILLTHKDINPSLSTLTSTSTCQVSPANLAYVIYTSGSTGRPKGVLVEHWNLTAYINAFEQEFHLGENDTVIQQVSYAFDAFVEELYPILLKGGKLVVPGKEVVRDIHALCDFIIKYRVTMITCSPQLLNELNNYSHLLLPLRILISGGDRLKADYITNLLEVGEVYNTYGPTEATVCASYYQCLQSTGLSTNVPIGKPITNYHVYILDQYRNLLPLGATGELCVAGAGVTRGYLNRPELTAEKFIIAPVTLYRSYMSYRTNIIYKTGDLARWLPDGNIEFLGRIDRQVKVRGYRIELGEIENQLLNIKNIKKVTVVESERASGQNFLGAYVVCEGSIEAAVVKEQLGRQLPGYMIPPYIIEIEEIPLTPSGKVDRQQLPSPRPEAHADHVYTAPGSDKEKIVAETWKEVLELNRVGLEDNFFDLGGTSLDIFKVNASLNRAFNRIIPVVALFQHSTIRALVRYLEEEENETGISEEKQLELSRALDKGKQILKKENKTGLEIAVIGMAGKFPGARDIDEFWENLKNGIEGIGFFTDEELAAEGIDEETLKNTNYIRARGIIAGPEYFDASFFGYTPREAQIMDPQIRIFAQCTWHALEDAGYDPFSYDQRIGLYAGASPNLQWEALTTFSNASQGLSGFMTRQLTDKDFMCTHISYKLNLKGPSYSVQTACSTSLVAIHWAVQGLLFGECEMALAGGVSITYPLKRGYHYQQGMIHSADGHNRTFAGDATGSVFGDGVGVIVLKKLADATADRDHIYAVIKGTATNNDGLRKVGYTAPSVEGQAQVIKAAQLTAEVEPESISFVEAHGTATPLGDTVEMEALKQAFNTDKKEFCAVGTVKSNVGHLYSAAGAAGFIKTVLAIKHRLIPPTLHFHSPNPQIDLKNSPFYVNTELREWKNNGHPLRAGVSSFGIGGTNAHVIMEEWPIAQSAKRMAQSEEHQARIEGTGGLAPLSNEVPSPSREHQLILLSAKTHTALDKQTERLVGYLQTHPNMNIPDMTYTLQMGRKHFPCRRMFLCAPKNLKESPDKENGLPVVIKKPQTLVAKEEKPGVIFMFCGQGSQYVNMGIDLYRTEPVFREEMDHCFEILDGLIDYNIKELLYPSPAFNRSNKSYKSYIPKIHQTEITQPVVFAFEYALARLLMKWGITPGAMIGYSLGEYIAACISGVLSLQDALKMIVFRGQLMQQTPVGAMTSVPLPEEELKPLLNKNLSLAIVNGPTCIVSGLESDVKAFEQEMKKKRVLCVGLNISNAMHSPLMKPIKKEFENMIKTKNIRLNKPQIPYISNVTADWLTEEQAKDPVYWGTHLCSTVRFSDGLAKLLKQDNSIFIEIGAGRILGMMVRVHPDKKPGHVIMNTLKHQQEKATDDQFLLERLGQLWLHGLHIDWKEFYRDEKRYRVSLPGYPFEGKRYWLERSSAVFAAPTASSPLDEAAPMPGLSTDAPGPGGELPPVSENYAAPQSELEKVITRLWQEFLGVEQVGIHDNFFFLNGNSLLATQLMARLMQDYPVEIPMNRFYENPTIAHLARLIEELQR